MVLAPSDHRERAAHEPLFHVHPRTGAMVEEFYADRTMETFGRCGAGWFWCCRRRCYSADGAAVGPFATSYAAYRNAMTSDSCIMVIPPGA
jgi:hypothetical protein